MVPITADVSLHHFATHHVAIVIAITFENMILLLGNRRVVPFIEAFFDEVDDLFTLFFRENRFGKTSVKKARNSHRMLRLCVWRVKARKVSIIGKVRGIILALSVGVTGRVVSKFLLQCCSVTTG
jgi:hypothetical protein